jgi:hypothetical protein
MAVFKGLLPFGPALIKVNDRLKLKFPAFTHAWPTGEAESIALQDLQDKLVTGFEPATG